MMLYPLIYSEVLDKKHPNDSGLTEIDNTNTHKHKSILMKTYTCTHKSTIAYYETYTQKSYITCFRILSPLESFLIRLILLKNLLLNLRILCFCSYFGILLDLFSASVRLLRSRSCDHRSKACAKSRFQCMDIFVSRTQNLLKYSCYPQKKNQCPQLL